MNAIWFSRHTPTTAQLAEIEADGNQLVAIDEGTALAAVEYNGTPETDTTERLFNLIRQNNAKAVYGVFPTHIMSLAFFLAECAVLRGDWIQPVTLYSAINFKRTEPGKPATFVHGGWRAIGVFDV